MYISNKRPNCKLAFISQLWIKQFGVEKDNWKRMQVNAFYKVSLKLVQKSHKCWKSVSKSEAMTVIFIEEPP